MSNKPIDVVLATYNGELYIRAQIDSIINNTNSAELINNIIIVDDGSNDSTVSIINELCHLYTKIKFYPSSGEKLGPVRNFERGLLLTSTNYIMLCDQDDKWLPNKISSSFDKIIEIENGDFYVPCLIFTDLQIVDSKLNTISQSFFDFNNVKFPRDLELEFLMANNVAPGCTMILNKALVAYSLPMPSSVIMHDWWLMIFAKCYGRIGVIQQPTIMYRQHSKNTVGVKINSLMNKILSINEQLIKFFSMKNLSIKQVSSLASFNCSLILNKDYAYSLSIYIKPLSLRHFFSLAFWSYQFNSERTFLRKIMLFLYILLRKNDVTN